MRRRTFDAIVTAAGLGLAVLLLVSGGLLTWGSTFVNSQVRSQLSAEQIFFPAAASPALADPAVAPYLTKYAGQQLTNGEQAKAYADHFIAVHLKKISGGQTYSALSAQAQKDPTNPALTGQVATVFRGETLRGLLLNAYAFGTMARIAGIAAVTAFTGAGLMLLLCLFGLLHLRRVSAEAELSVPGWHPESTRV